MTKYGRQWPGGAYSTNQHLTVNSGTYSTLDTEEGHYQFSGVSEIGTMYAVCRTPIGAAGECQGRMAAYEYTGPETFGDLAAVSDAIILPQASGSTYFIIEFYCPMTPVDASKTYALAFAASAGDVQVYAEDTTAADAVGNYPLSGNVMFPNPASTSKTDKAKGMYLWANVTTAGRGGGLTSITRARRHILEAQRALRR